MSIQKRRVASRPWTVCRYHSQNINTFPVTTCFAAHRIHEHCFRSCLHHTQYTTEYGSRSSYCTHTSASSCPLQASINRLMIIKQTRNAGLKSVIGAALEIVVVVVAVVVGGTVVGIAVVVAVGSTVCVPL